MILRTTAALLLLVLSGCATSPPPPEPMSLHIEPGLYEQAFTVAEEAARAEGLAPALRDRRGGIIETDAFRAPTLLEPWAWTGRSGRELTAATASHMRRRARFEFSRPGESMAASEPMPAPELLGGPGEPQDLLRYGGPLELRVWVAVEREQEPGTRRDTWTRSLTTQADLVAGPGALEDDVRSYWVPVARDRWTERRLLEAVRAGLTE